MALPGTEADIINSVARLRKATKDQIRKEVGFSSDYIGFLCQYLVRKGYLTFSNGCYSLNEVGIETLPREKQEIDKAEEAKKQIYPAPFGWCGIKIKTDFEFPVEDESLALESNVGKIGVKVEKEKSNIDRSIQLFKEIQKEVRKDE